MRFSTDESTVLDATPASVTDITITMDTNARVGYIEGAGTQADPAVFSKPGSVRFIATGAGTQGTDTGFDLSSVEWGIALYNGNGERYALAPSDTHIDRNGILTIGDTAKSGDTFVVAAKSTVGAAPGQFFVTIGDDK